MKREEGHETTLGRSKGEEMGGCGGDKGSSPFYTMEYGEKCPKMKRGGWGQKYERMGKERDDEEKETRT